MSDFEESRLAEYERLLIRSAQLDLPDAAARERALEAGLEELRSPRGARRSVVFGAFAGGALVAAGAALLFHLQEPRPDPAPVLVAEAPAPNSAQRALPKLPPACPEIVVARGDSPLIDDWEDNDARILKSDGRVGAWTAYDDGTSQMKTPAGSPLLPTPIAGRRGESRKALHTAGGKFEKWGVTLTADLADGACYDSSAYGGVQFWARGKGVMYVGVQVIDVQALKFGGFCANDCYNVHRKAVELKGSWQRVTARWDELQQLWPIGKIGFDPKRIRLVEFTFLAENTPFEVWIDDLEFMPR